MAETEPKTRQTEEGGAASVTEVLKNANEDIDPKTQELLNKKIAPQIDAMFAKQNAIIDNQNATISELQKALGELKVENERLRTIVNEQSEPSESHPDFSQYFDIARNSLYGEGGVFASANTEKNSTSRSSEASMDTCNTRCG